MPPPPRTIALTRLRSPDQAKLEAAVVLGDVAMRFVRRAEKTLAAHNLTLPQFDVLTNLSMHDGLTQQDLAARLQVTKGNVCGLLDRLEKMNYVRRRPDENDGRINRLAITPLGRRLIEAMRPLHDVAILDLISAWDVADVDALQAVLAKVKPNS